MRRRERRSRREAAHGALPFLLQSLAALDMATRGFVEAAERVTIEQAHVAQLQRLAQWFSGAYVDLLADQRLRRMTAWLRRSWTRRRVYPVRPIDARSGRRTSVPDGLAETVATGTNSATARGAAADETSGSGSRHGSRSTTRTRAPRPACVVVWRAGEFTDFDEAVLAQFGKLASARCATPNYTGASTTSRSRCRAA